MQPKVKSVLNSQRLFAVIVFVPRILADNISANFSGFGRDGSKMANLCCKISVTFQRTFSGNNLLNWASISFDRTVTAHYNEMTIRRVIQALILTSSGFEAHSYPTTVHLNP